MLIFHKSRIRNRRKSGFTIVELLVATSLFIVVVTIASSLIIAATKTQRVILNFAGITQNTSLALEGMAREIRNTSSALVSQSSINDIRFKVYNPDTGNVDVIVYSQGTYNGISYVQRQVNGGSQVFITGDQANVTRLEFYCIDDNWNGTFNPNPPFSPALCNGRPVSKILIFMDVQSVGDARSKKSFQTVVAPRH